ncbi:NDP-sugar epimerase, includes UDP-GlcNAc-inverting 4,6-dehydratase FlaA1 and capsular polysaccharide biosynthesis protein EpsC [Algoriphagus alkaliphilus]|uniref:NDP-sugar epimerase, includes UDP-GlcNAc-inverting 4,6-dehydratase FlaA1 and capsular polysaccharide biosynthesis protein EpsC n=1 Tax=Algoriphagus alkaliphilus TaxID=279824 RepID=A0A1G5W3N7_9BACT|nr:nucleoside-diphosphate sugar epimerase/dehydratase [Algoriphagus alkaliphilus]SDA52719.1 NDP-sugar epimerase, includes UDP-GlcNAc-inverting 4,6-dehydratase FlaA1 and capsular polysaccharide biosynthesis protein EpsC [Algoriphagus alkaliphilus]
MNFLSRLKILPRWIIASLDSLILFHCALFGYLVRFNFELELIEQYDAFAGSFTFMIGGLLVMQNTRSYEGIVRHTGFRDGSNIFKTVLINFILFLFLNFFHGSFLNDKFLLPTSVLIVASLSAMFMLIFYRLLVKELFVYLKNGFAQKDLRHGVIFGAGEAGIIAQEAIKNDSKSQMNIVAFLDDDTKKDGKNIDGKRIYKGLDDLEKLVKQFNITELIIAVRDLSVHRKNEIIDECLRLNVSVSMVPPVDQWINGGLTAGAIREIKIEDLLSREQIILDNPRIEQDLKDKVVMVSGAAGSIGSELCRQISYYHPKLIVMLDIAESPLYDIEQEFREQHPNCAIKIVLGDVKNKKKMKEIFKEFKPQVVFHAAAYKHVPMMENYPEEAVHANVIGTKILADLSVLSQVEKFVFVSTDKAVNPTNVMGASKRAAEMYVQALNEYLEANHKKYHTRFITTRFGNVLGSNGSVIPLFKKQILNGGPISVTHPDITRYFMTIPEACQLVLEAGVMGEGGEIFVFDMGEPLKILDLAKKMIQLSGKKVDVDIKIQFTGLREGEKLYEELLNDFETVKITHHPKIKIAQVQTSSYHRIDGQIEFFHELIGKNNETDLVRHLKSLVPEYISNSSRFEVLDRMN